MSSSLQPATRYPSSPSSTASSESDEDGPGPDPLRRGDDRNLRINCHDSHPTAPALTTPSAKAGSHPWPFNSLNPNFHSNLNGSESHPTTNLTEVMESDNEGTVTIALPPGSKPRTESVTQWIKTLPGSEPPTIQASAPLSSSLPHEILIQILRSVTSTSDLRPSTFFTAFPPTKLIYDDSTQISGRALLVCKAWCQCGVELLWHKPTFPSTSCLIKMLVSLASKNQTFPYISFIRRLNFSGIADHMTDHILIRLVNCTRLERLTLSGCNSITDDSIIKILKNSSDLVALDLSDCKLVTDKCVHAAGLHCKLLQGLNLSGCKAITDEGLQALKNCKALRRLKLKYCEKITDAALISVTVACPLLLEVDLVGCRLITNASLWMLWKHSSHLRELSLSGCSEISDGGFPSALNPVIGADGESHPILEPEEQLDEPSTSTTMTTTNQGYYNLRRAEEPLMHFDHIRFLDLTSLVKLTDASLEGIIKHMPRIRNLVLAKCIGLTDESLNSICGLGKYLHYLHLGHVSSLTDRAVIKVARSCTRLRYIDLACCNNLTDMSVFELAQCLPRLKRIGLVRVTNITDQSVYTLVERTSLERIHLSYCDNISVGAIHWLLQRLHRLTHLSLTGVPAFRRTDLQAWCRAPPKDFNAHQRQAFCVYSGKGVNELRFYLAALYTSITAATSSSSSSVSATSSNTSTHPRPATTDDPSPAPNLAVFNSMPDPHTMAAAMAAARQQANPPRTSFKLPERRRLHFADFLELEARGHNFEPEQIYNRALTIARQQFLTPVPDIPGQPRRYIYNPPSNNSTTSSNTQTNEMIAEEVRTITRRRSDLEQQLQLDSNSVGGVASGSGGGGGGGGLLEVPDRRQSASPMDISDDERPPP
ncbi:hypothetical protein CROQUDRAFT_93816 [Cronartium quercuum f. sp. fusiforme G11]|uniref:F-box/LRR-repeat protein 15-like leucin rich repeat domain-containing protein n=1 Tax=Cronartium quercuum f. sp. fusiforme G11 TaxID=708437 RepID=A0A9P6NH20_9BASI|nr:hypothetical protein CROQUDRAFT_93816 [Cronartium quercuum f. sp. fusiforme G11]